jgi:hypothetical protein
VYIVRITQLTIYFIHNGKVMNILQITMYASYNEIGCYGIARRKYKLKVYTCRDIERNSQPCFEIDSKLIHLYISSSHP